MIYRYIVPGISGDYQKFTYPAGEMQVRFCSSDITQIKEADRIVAIVRPGFSSPGQIMELALTANAIHGIKRPSASFDLVIPYLPYSRADRRFVEGDCFGLAVFAQIINTMRFDRVITLDVHSDHAATLIKGLVNVSAKPLIETALACLPVDTAIILPDAGAKRYHILTHPTYQCTKVRNPGTGALLDFSVPVEEIKKHSAALLIDDICDGGGTFTGIGEKFDSFPLWLYVSHGLFSKGTDRLNRCFKAIMTSDSFAGEFTGVTRISALDMLLEA